MGRKVPSRWSIGLRLGRRQDFSDSLRRGILGSLYPAVCEERLLGSTEELFAPLLCIEVNATCLSCAWISAVVNGTGSSTRRWNSLLWGLRLLDCADPLELATTGMQRNQPRVINGHLTLV